jgi:hypothetical protein
MMVSEALAMVGKLSVIINPCCLMDDGSGPISKEFLT